MFRYLVRRILWAILLFLIITFVTFVIFFIAPADPARAQCGGERSSPACLELATEKLGLDKQKLFDISSKSSGQCWSMTSYCPVPGPVPASPANRDYQAGFTAAMMLKDLKLAQEAAHAAGVATPLGAAAQALYALYVEGGRGGDDFSGIIRMLAGR